MQAPVNSRRKYRRIQLRPQRVTISRKKSAKTGSPARLSHCVLCSSTCERNPGSFITCEPRRENVESQQMQLRGCAPLHQRRRTLRARRLARRAKQSAPGQTATRKTRSPRGTMMIDRFRAIALRCANYSSSRPNSPKALFKKSIRSKRDSATRAIPHTRPHRIARDRHVRNIAPKRRAPDEVMVRGIPSTLRVRVVPSCSCCRECWSGGYRRVVPHRG